MIRISKQNQRRATSPRKYRAPAKKTGPKADNLPKGYKEHSNAIEGDLAQSLYIGKLKKH